jgi:hypothetical protein
MCGVSFKAVGVHVIEPVMKGSVKMDGHVRRMTSEASHIRGRYSLTRDLLQA